MKTKQPTVNIEWRNDRDDVYYIVIRWKGKAYRKSTGIQGKSKTGWRRVPEILDELEAVEARLGAYNNSYPDIIQPFGKNPVEDEKNRFWGILMELARTRNFSDHTYRNYHRAMEMYIERFGDRLASSDETQGWAKDLRYRYTNSCIWAYFIALKSIFNFAEQRGMVEYNPFKWGFTRSGYKPRLNPKARELKEVYRLWDLWEKEHNVWAGIWLAGYTFCGLAMVDILRLDFKNMDIQLLNGEEYYCFTIDRQKTNQTARCVVKANQRSKALKNLMIEVQGWGGTAKSLTERVNRHLGELDFKPKLCYYQARHTYATQLVMTGTPLNVIATLLGRNVRQIEVYISQIQNNETLAKNVKGLEIVDFGSYLQ